MKKKQSRKTKTTVDAPVADYRHTKVKRKNIPPAGLAAQGKIAEKPAERYFYNPHLSPVLRFDATGKADRLPELLETARQRPLTGDEVRCLAAALRNHEPWLEWAGKREKKSFEIDPVALHIHERVSTQAILRVAARQDVNRDLFADPEQEYREAVQFYQHDVDWANRLILGDSLVVMSSLAKREDLAGKVQMIYIDPPYGINFKSNFQPDIANKEVKDKEQDLTREPEMVKAYRDTWRLGVHSYLSYLRERLIVAKDLLADGGSIFVQIGEENLHLVRNLLDEVFGAGNAVVTITVKKKSSTVIGASVADYILWYGKDRGRTKLRKVPADRGEPEDAGKYRRIELETGERRRAALVPEEIRKERAACYVRDDYPVDSQHPSETRSVEITVEGQTVKPGPNRQWTFDPNAGMKRLEHAGRLRAGNRSAFGIVYWGDSSTGCLPNLWTDTHGEANPVYAVQTNHKIIDRCLLMTTDPGDLVLDPTCGSGTTAYCAEKWGRRWITIDTSRVGIAIARQRLLTERYDYLRLRPINAEDMGRNPAGTWLSDPQKQFSGPCTFVCKTVPSITLKSIVQNVALDPIFAKHEPVLAEKLKALNASLKDVTSALRTSLLAKLEAKRKRKDKSDRVTEADERRWRLPHKKWEEWEVPFDTDPDWPKNLQTALTDYRVAWRAKVDEVNACIVASADQEELVDQPDVDRSVLRVSGPFTVEAVQPAEETLDIDSPIGGEPDSLETFTGKSAIPEEPANAEAYLDKMIRLLRGDGIRFPDNKEMKFARLDPLSGDILHAEGEWANGGGKKVRRVAVAFGPQYGPVTAKQVEDCLRSAHRRGFDDLVFAGFTFDGAAQAAVQEESRRQGLQGPCPYCPYQAGCEHGRFAEGYAEQPIVYCLWTPSDKT